MGVAGEGEAVLFAVLAHDVGLAGEEGGAGAGDAVEFDHEAVLGVDPDLAVECEVVLADRGGGEDVAETAADLLLPGESEPVVV